MQEVAGGSTAPLKSPNEDDLKMKYSSIARAFIARRQKKIKSHLYPSITTDSAFDPSPSSIFKKSATYNDNFAVDIGETVFLPSTDTSGSVCSDLPSGTDVETCANNLVECVGIKPGISNCTSIDLSPDNDVVDFRILPDDATHHHLSANNSVSTEESTNFPENGDSVYEISVIASPAPSPGTSYNSLSEIAVTDSHGSIPHSSPLKHSSVSFSLPQRFSLDVEPRDSIDHLQECDESKISDSVNNNISARSIFSTASSPSSANQVISNDLSVSGVGCENSEDVIPRDRVDVEVPSLNSDASAMEMQETENEALSSDDLTDKLAQGVSNVIHETAKDNFLSTACSNDNVLDTGNDSGSLDGDLGYTSDGIQNGFAQVSESGNSCEGVSFPNEGNKSCETNFNERLETNHSSNPSVPGASCTPNSLDDGICAANESNRGKHFTDAFSSGRDVGPTVPVDSSTLMSDLVCYQNTRNESGKTTNENRDIITLDSDEEDLMILSENIKSVPAKPPRKVMKVRMTVPKQFKNKSIADLVKEYDIAGKDGAKHSVNLATILRNCNNRGNVTILDKRS